MSKIVARQITQKYILTVSVRPVLGSVNMIVPCYSRLSGQPSTKMTMPPPDFA
ncbi:MAG: hypothetical protein IPP57_21620 [Candidatus Obscuribacter sp.]|nr:hypothetical protein [Candidatus Obscuribacter sp.]